MTGICGRDPFTRFANGELTGWCREYKENASLYDDEYLFLEFDNWID